eukprot:97757_1
MAYSQICTGYVLPLIYWSLFILALLTLCALTYQFINTYNKLKESKITSLFYVGLSILMLLFLSVLLLMHSNMDKLLLCDPFQQIKMKTQHGIITEANTIDRITELIK